MKEHNTIPRYQPKVVMEAYQADFFIEKDFDHISPYPCGVCGQNFNSRIALSTHPHGRGTA